MCSPKLPELLRNSSRNMENSSRCWCGFQISQISFNYSIKPLCDVLDKQVRSIKDPTSQLIGLTGSAVMPWQIRTILMTQGAHYSILGRCFLLLWLIFICCHTIHVVERFLLWWDHSWTFWPWQKALHLAKT